MPVLSSVIEDLLDLMLEQAKLRVEEYANDVKHDLEVLADTIVRRAIRAIVINVFAVLLVLAGFIFTFIGIVTYLSPLISPAVAWAVVGLAMTGIGVLVLDRIRGLATSVRRVRHGNGN